MKKLILKYGINPNQKPAEVFMQDDSDLPFEVLNGQPGYINLLDALNAYQLVKELYEATNIPCATSFKHVSPTSSALGLKMDDKLKKAYFVNDVPNLESSSIALAYARARGTDRLSSFGDFIALSSECDLITAKLIHREVSDGIIAPSYSKEALELLKTKKKGKYVILKMNENYTPNPLEYRTVYGVTFMQKHNDFKVDSSTFKNIVTKNKNLTKEAILDLTVGLITLKYTQSNSVCFSYNGQAIGVGAGQQSRVHCTRLAGNKTDLWFLRQADKVLNLPFKDNLKRADKDNLIDIYLSNDYDEILTDGMWEKYFTNKPEVFSLQEKKEYLSKIKGVSLTSDAFFPFDDNIQRAYKSGVSYVCEPGGSIRDEDVIKRADSYDMVMVFNNQRLFHH